MGSLVASPSALSSSLLILLKRPAGLSPRSILASAIDSRAGVGHGLAEDLSRMGPLAAFLERLEHPLQLDRLSVALRLSLGG